MNERADELARAAWRLFLANRPAPREPLKPAWRTNGRADN